MFLINILHFARQTFDLPVKTSYFSKCTLNDALRKVARLDG